MFVYIDPNKIKSLIDSYPEDTSPYKILSERLPSFNEIPFSKRMELICRAYLEPESKSCLIIVIDSESFLDGLEAIVYVDGNLVTSIDITKEVCSGLITVANQEETIITLLKRQGILDVETNYSCIVSGL